MNQYLTKTDDQLDDILHDDIQSYVSSYRKINIYNNNIKKPFQKIWLSTSKLKILGKIYIPENKNQIALLSLILYDGDPECVKLKEK